jgi:hypothetical protein
MKRTRVRIISFGVVFLGTAILCCLQLRPLLAHLRLDDENWCMTATPEQLRDAAHSALSIWFADPHQAVIVLSVYGDKSSIPYLRKALANAPELPGGGVVCTWQHAQDTLDRLVAEGRAADNKKHQNNRDRSPP